MCVGLPCVATDCTPGGARLLIEDGINGVLIPRGKVDAIVKGCEKILSNPAQGEKMGIKAQEICEKYSPEAIYPMWNEYLMKIVADE